MARLKTFLKYFIWFLVVFAIVGFFTPKIMFSRFKPVEDGQIEESVVELNQILCKSTKLNGYIEGTAKNNTGEYINKLTMNIELYNNNDKLVKTEILEIEDFKKEEEKPFKIFYHVDNVERYKIVDIEYK